MATRIHLTDRADRWRYVCPLGHRSWEPTNHHFWCQQCAQHYEVAGEFDVLRDTKTGAFIERDDIFLDGYD